MENLHIASAEYMAYEGAIDRLKSLRSKLSRVRREHSLSDNFSLEFKNKEHEIFEDYHKTTQRTLSELNNLVELRTSEVEALISRI